MNIVYIFQGGQIKADELTKKPAPHTASLVPPVGSIVRFQDAEGSKHRPQPILRRLRVTGPPEVVYVSLIETILVPCELAEDVEMVDRE